jgi:LPS sulfotransferase NodH
MNAPPELSGFWNSWRKTATVPLSLTYIIASTVRTGSYLLCEGLEATDCAGRPTESFCPDHRVGYCRRRNLPVEASFGDFFRAAIENGCTPNGVYGVKIHSHHLEPLARESGFAGEPFQVLPHLFPGAQYIDLRRQDRRAQAISYYRAQVTNEWWRIHGVVNTYIRRTEAPFDAVAICALEDKLAEQLEAWDRFFAMEKIEPLRMDYETLCRDYRGEMARTLAFLGQDPALAVNLPEPRLVRQADETTKTWRRELDTLFPPERHKAAHG